MYEQIRNLREDKNLSQEQMSKILNVSQTTYSRYETGILDIPTEILIKLANYHHVTVDYLLGRE